MSDNETTQLFINRKSIGKPKVEDTSDLLRVTFKNRSMPDKKILVAGSAPALVAHQVQMTVLQHLGMLFPTKSSSIKTHF